MSTLAEKRSALAASQEKHVNDHKRIAQIAAEILDTDAGLELLDHLSHRFGLASRVFIPGDHGEINALRGAIRDGERSVVTYLIHLIKTAKPAYKIQL